GVLGLEVGGGVLVQGLEGGRQAALDGRLQLIGRVAQAQGGLLGQVLVLRVAADGEVDTADGRVGGAARRDGRVGRPLEVLEQGGLVGLHRGVHERVVDLEGGGAVLHGEPVLILLLYRQRGIRGRGRRQLLHGLHGRQSGLTHGGRGR